MKFRVDTDIKNHHLSAFLLSKAILLLCSKLLDVMDE